METKYGIGIGSMLAVLMAAMVIGTAAGGVAVPSHFVAGSEPKLMNVGGHELKYSQLPATGTLLVTVSWCSSQSQQYCVPIGTASVLVTNTAGAYVTSGQTNSNGQASFTVNSPGTYIVNVDISGVSAFGYMSGAVYQTVTAVSGSTTNAVFQFDQPGPLPW